MRKMIADREKALKSLQEKYPDAEIVFYVEVEEEPKRLELLNNYLDAKKQFDSACAIGKGEVCLHKALILKPYATNEKVLYAELLTDNVVPI